MPAWNLAELMSAATAALGNRADLAQSTVSFWTNAAYSDVWHRLRHDEQEVSAVTSTNTNDDRVHLPTDFGSLIGSPSNISFDNRLLTEINVDQLVSWSSTSGRPTHYASYGSRWELRPIPDSRYSLGYRYRRLRSDMTLTTTEPSIATYYRPAIYQRAVQLLAENVVLDHERAALAERQYERFISSMPNDSARRARDQHALGCSLSWRGAVTPRSARSFDRDI